VWRPTLHIVLSTVTRVNAPQMPLGRDVSVCHFTAVHPYCTNRQDLPPVALALLLIAACAGNSYSLPGATSCTLCPGDGGPASLVPNSARNGCQCPPGYAPPPGAIDFSKQGEDRFVFTRETCLLCPAGTFADPLSTCQPCSGYYQYSTAGASSCSTCE
jgi:hypothetical protein